MRLATSCVQGMVCAFGYVAEEEIVLNKHGRLAALQWQVEQYPCLKYESIA
ncbi:hypothetical protein [Pontibacter flavimaris]|uniref:hypothetical protein n=1 Tax=Pontibacter flavimaris TaxID=1797110 RepID=UPI00147CA4DA|nr:hypothetical protein [Pontibacter flavimaris]